MIVNDQQDRIGHESCQRNEIGPGGLRRPTKQLIHFSVTGKSVVMGEERVAVRSGAGGELRADLPRGTGFGLDHDRLLYDRFKCRSQRPRHEIVGTTGRKRVDDGDCTRRKSLLCVRGDDRERCGRCCCADDEITPVHVPTPVSLRSW
jgi:hypothetical protein